MGFYEDGLIALSQLQTFLNQSINQQKPVIRQQTIKNLHEQLKLRDYVKEGGLSSHNLEQFLETYLDNSTRIHHPGFMAHQVGAPHPSGALASLVDGFTNNAMNIYEMGPAAAAIEFFMINYLLTKVGWETMPLEIEQRLTFDHGAGLLTHGGSLANMTALLAARNWLDKTLRASGNPGDLTILVPSSSHYSVAKTAGIIGIGENNIIDLATDVNGRIIPDKLEQAFLKAKDRNKRIVALVANACSTGTGLYDPIDEIADFCKEKEIWFHVDGAHGACALFSRKNKSYLKGIEKADSVILDAHKMLRTPTICAALIVKDAPALDHVFKQEASYLFHDKQQPGFDFIGQTIECTKAGLGLRFYLVLAAMGEKGLEQYVDQQFFTVRQAYDYLQEQPDFECPCEPESNILCFRIDAPDKVQLAIRDQLILEGRFYLSSTTIKDKRYLRIVNISPETTLKDIIEMVFQIRKISDQEIL